MIRSPYRHRYTGGPSVAPSVANLVAAIVAAIATALLVTSCGDAPEGGQTPNTVLDLFAGDAFWHQELVDAINNEGTQIQAAFEELEDEEVIAALIGAGNRGVRVEIVADVDHQNDPGMLRLESAQIPIRYIDGELRYLPDPNMSSILKASGGILIRPSGLSTMSHNFIILGEVDVWTFADPFLARERPTTGFHIRSQYAAEDYTREFKQLFAGVGSTRLDVYNGPVKSSVHKHPYETSDGDPFFYSDSIYTSQGRLRLLFSPQQKPLKTLIDEVYRAKGSIYIQSDSIEEPALLAALEYKRRNGFSVKIVVSDTAQLPGYRSRIQAIGGVAAKGAHLATVVILDHEPGVGDGYRYPRQALVLTYPILRTAAVEVVPEIPDDIVLQHASDQFVDGNGWMLTEVQGNPAGSRPIDLLLQSFNEHYVTASPLL